MPDKLLGIEQVLTMLAAAPPRIEMVTAGLAAARLHSSPGQGEWSTNDVLCHLRACADVWGGSIVSILTQDKPTLRAVNPRTWINKTDYLEQEFRPSLRAFALQRTDLLAVLEPLGPEGWSRSATVTGAGKPLERTVLFYARWLASHERPHLPPVS